MSLPLQKSARKARGDGHLRRGEILDAAERIFAAEGYEAATIRRIADAVGVSSTALYLHFPDKACILAEICRRTLEHLLTRNRQLAALPLPPLDRVRMMVEAHMRWGLEHPKAYQLVYSAPPPRAANPWSDQIMDLSVQCYMVFEAVVREIAAEGRLRGQPPEIAAQVFWMSCHGVVALLCSRPNFQWAGDEVLMTATLDALVTGLIAD